MSDRRTLADFRTRVADLYTDVRRDGASEATWQRWRQHRDALFASHPDSPVAGVDGWDGMPFWPYDPSWHVLGDIDTSASGPDISIQQQSGLVERFEHSGVVRFRRNDSDYELPLYWAWSYSGGWFLPFADDTSGDETFGVGRYLIDQAKSAHLGSEGGSIVLDFNFAYHPSCVWGEWLCPLPRPESLLSVAVRAGERAS